MKGIALSCGVYIINLSSDTYLFSPEKFLSADIDSIIGKYIKKLNTKCSRKISNTKESNDTPPYTAPSADKNSLKEEDVTESELNLELDLKKVFVVDDEKTLEKAIKEMENCSELGLDLEGQLNKGGAITLAQIACGEMIYILDLYKASITDKTVHDKMMGFLKKVIEDPKIAKVFHDSRKDSLALHLFGHCCPVRVVDVSGLYSFIKNLNIYSAFHIENMREHFKYRGENDKEIPLDFDLK
jgi:hypothetical protein